MAPPPSERKKGNPIVVDTTVQGAPQWIIDTLKVILLDGKKNKIAVISDADSSDEPGVTVGSDSNN